MQIISAELEIRKREVDNYIRSVEKMECGEYTITGAQSEIDSILLRTSIKASIVLMLYNVVESTMTKCLTRIHEVIKQNNLHYSQLNEQIKKVILSYYEMAMRTMNQSDDVNKVADIHIKQIELIKDRAFFQLSYDELIEYYPLYSGNLDAKQIKNILKKYGIIFEEKSSELKTIKEYRNHLAHGEMSFEEVGRAVSIQQLRVMYNSVFTFWEKVIVITSTYLDEKSFKNNIY